MTTSALPVVVAETLYFRARYREGDNPAFVRRAVWHTGPTNTVEHYTLSGSDLEFVIPPCDDTASCVWSFPSGTITGDEIVVSYLEPSFRTRVYQRVP
jgi:hypothetical protein